MDKKGDRRKSNIFKLIQDFLKPIPVIIWGSGATIPFGFPSMEALKKEIGINDSGNLENILNNCNENQLDEYCQNIFKVINKKDKDFIDKINDGTFEHLEPIIRYFYKTHPQCFNIITTNYDCVLEYLLSYYSYPFSDGFSGRQFSKFDKSNFEKNAKHINLFKVHGSLRWFNDRYCYKNEKMQAIYPSKHKSQQAHQEPFRTLITKSDTAIENAKNFLVIGFGFGDDHLTPKLDQAIKKEYVKMVIVTRKATNDAKKYIENANNIVLIEREESKEKNKTKFTYKNNNNQKEEILDGSFWKLEEFKSILLEN